MTFTVACPGTKHVFGGGARVVGSSTTVQPNLTISESAPTADGTGWFVQYSNFENGLTFRMIIFYAICGDVQYPRFRPRPSTLPRSRGRAGWGPVSAFGG